MYLSLHRVNLMLSTFNYVFNYLLYCVLFLVEESWQ